MKNRYVLFTLTMLILLFAMGSIVSAEDVDVNSVSEVLDENLIASSDVETISQSQPEILSDAPGSLTDLQDIISSSGDVVNLDKNYSYKQGDSKNGVYIDKSVTINGNGYTIDGAGESLIFEIVADNVVLNNIIFVNGNGNNFGAINWVGNDGVLANSTLRDNGPDYSTITYGAVGLRGYNYVIDNNYFISNHGSGYAHGIYSQKGSVLITNNHFLNTDDDFSSNAIWIDGNNSILDNNEFCNLHTYDGSAIQVSHSNSGYASNAYNNLISNSRFYNCSACASAVNIQALAINTTVINCTFDFCSNPKGYGGAILSYSATNTTIRNCNFTNCSANSDGTLDLSYSENCVVDNVIIINSTATQSTGAIYISGNNTKILNTKIINSTAIYTAGAITWDSPNSLIENLVIENASIYAVGYGGGIFCQAPNCIVRNATIRNSYATYFGGAIFVQRGAKNMLIEDSRFEYNIAGHHTGGVLFWESDAIIRNSNFTNNHADYGAGAIGNVGNNISIIGCIFNGNYANNYGGALSITDAYVENCVFNYNSAVFGGAIYTINSTIIDSTFTGNTAEELGSKVFAINHALILNSNVLPDEVYNNNLTRVITVLGNSAYQLFAEIDGESVHVYSTEWFLNNFFQFDNYPLTLDNSFKLFRNKLDSSNVGEYVKLLFYLYEDYLTDQINSYAGYYFGDYNYYDISAWYVKYVYDAYNMGMRAPDIEIKNNNVILYNYSMLITPTPYKNSLFFSKTVLPLSINVTKEALNNEIIVGNNVKFRINITNTGKYNLTDVFFNEIFKVSELEYVDFESNNNWTYNSTNNMFLLLDKLAINQTVSIILTFKTLNNGTLLNNVSAGFNKNNTNNASSSVKVYRPNMTVTKVSLPHSVAVGDQVEFEIIVKNTGDMDLTDVVITEDSYDGLTYAGYHESDAWSYAFVNGKHTWSLKHALIDDEILFVIFNTTKTGNFTNTIVVNSKEVKNKTADAKVSVLEHNFTVEKVALTNITKLGDQTIFEVVVHNTGETDLHDVFVIEDSYPGLTFDHVRQATRWSHSLTVDGKHKWTFNEVLPAHEWVFLFMVFNTTELGNFTNTVIAGSSDTINKTANATVWVNETVHKPEGDIHELNIAITTIHPLVIVGNQTMFEIIVHNVGNTILHNVTVAEDIFDDLIFDHFVDYTGYWIPKFTPSVQNGLLGAPVFREFTWQMNDELFVGEYTGFFVVFNTTKTGVFSNTVLGSSDETPEKPATDIVNVVKPEYAITKSLENDTDLYVGDEIHFKIIVTNVGQVNLTNLVIKELPEEGLEFIKLIDENHMWTQDGLTFKLNSDMLPDEEVEMVVVFKASNAGTYINTVVSSVDNLDDKTASDDVRVLAKKPVYGISIDTRVIDTPVYVGNTSLIEITVTNTGNDELKDVFVKLGLNKDLIYLSYVNGSRNWTNKGDIFNLVGTLKVGKSATFYVLVNTTKEGNFSSIAEAGFNNTTKVNSKFNIEVLDKTTGKNNSQNTVVSKNQNSNSSKINKTSYSDKKHYASNVKVSKNATGNPILVLIAILICLPILRRKF